MSNTPFTCKSF